MNSQHYLEGLLEKYNLTENDIAPIKSQRKKIENFLKNHYCNKISNFYYSGSYSKNTAINLKYDLDLCIYFEKSAFYSPKEMFDDVCRVLSANYQVRRQRVSLGLLVNNKNIDIVPAKRMDDTTTRAYLHETSGHYEKGIQTNIPEHKKHISESQCRPLIKLMKIWKCRHHLDYKSFALELLTIKASKNSMHSDLESQFRHTLKFIKENVAKINLIDPGNHENNVAKIIETVDKSSMMIKADVHLREPDISKIIW